METGELRAEVRKAYSAAAEMPGARHAFPAGRDFAESLGYPGGWLREMPAPAVEAFTGVSNVSVFAEIPPGAVVLDLGCGAGLDALIAARRACVSGRIIGIDFSRPMLERAVCASRAADVRNVAFCQADAERLPVATESIDVALVNGIFNLNPARKQIFGELARVMKEGGAVYAAELILRGPLEGEAAASAADWFA